MVGRKLAIFVDGEFWHGKKLSEGRLAQMSEYWQRKIRRNVERDQDITSQLGELGWMVVRVTDRAVHRDVSTIADFVEDVAAGRFEMYPPDGVESHRAPR